MFRLGEDFATISQEENGKNLLRDARAWGLGVGTVQVQGY